MIKAKEDTFHLGAKALICNSNKEILLLEKRSRFDTIYWDLPGGRLQRGESPLEALKREIMEEIGMTEIGHIEPFITVLTDFRIQIAQDDVGLILSIFLCDLKDSFSPVLSDEHIGFKWLSIDECSQKLIRYPLPFREKLTSLAPQKDSYG